MGIVESFRAPTRPFVLRWAYGLLTANIVIVVTGAVVRLTGSGLGCPTWPQCTEDSFVPHRSLGIHGAIEFGNRMLTYVLIAVAIATLLAVWRWAGATAPMRQIITVLALGIPFQGVIGGLTVLTDLNPWIVSLHLLLSMALISGSVLLIVRVSAAAAVAVRPSVSRLVEAVYVLTWIVVYLGTVVTGSGPHAGDAVAPRNGLNPEAMSHIHAVAVYVLVASTALMAWALRGTGRPFSWSLALLAVECAQAVVGLVQFWTGLPIVLVGLHVLGAAVTLAVSTSAVLSVGHSAAVRVHSKR